jgi:hypothetical protein
MIPAHVVQTKLNERSSHINISIMGGVIENWSLIWNDKRKSQCHIGLGWYTFFDKTLTCIGDKIQFWYQGPGIFRVTIYNC